MIDSTSTSGPQRPRVRRGLGVLVGAALMVTPLALAPAAHAQAQLRTGPDLISQILALVQQILGGLGHTLQTPLGEQAPNSSPRPCQVDGIATLLSCLVAPLQQNIDPGKASKATVKAKVRASLKNGKVTSIRVVK